MAGFVVFEENRARGVSNATWRATVPPAAGLLPERSPARGYGSGDLVWGDAAETTTFLRLFDGLLAMFDDPEMGRPMWPTPA